MSKVEELYNQLQGLTGGNIPWSELSRQHQDVFIQGINMLIAITQQRKQG